MSEHIASDHPTHSFHPTPEGHVCHDCDARPGRAPNPCPAYLDEARDAHARIAALLLRGMHPAPKIPPPDAPISEHRAHGYAVADWQNELHIRESACRSIGRMLGFDISPDDTLPVMSKP
jgi:hypothetical protein